MPVDKFCELFCEYYSKERLIEIYNGDMICGEDKIVWFTTYEMDIEHELELADNEDYILFQALNVDKKTRCIYYQKDSDFAERLDRYVCWRPDTIQEEEIETQEIDLNQMKHTQN